MLRHDCLTAFSSEKTTERQGYQVVKKFRWYILAQFWIVTDRRTPCLELCG